MVNILGGPAIGAVSWYSEMAPQKATRPKLFSRSNTAWKILPPTFSKSASMPCGQSLSSTAPVSRSVLWLKQAS